MSSSEESGDDGIIEERGETVDSDGEIPGDERNDATEEAPEEGSEKQVVKPKRIVRNPQPKLNEETLKGKRGLAALPSYFERAKYKGKGYEEEDLKVILKTYEYWCHRLFPKYPFDAALAKIEKLGSKRAVITHIKKIRSDMICDDDESVPQDLVDSDGENDNIDDLFDEVAIPDVQSTPPAEITEEQQEQIRLNRERAEKLRLEKLKKAKEKSASSLGESLNLSQVSGLTEKQLELIRQNREKAERLRLERLGKIETSSQIGSPKQMFSESLSQLSSIHSLDFQYQNSVQEENPLE